MTRLEMAVMFVPHLIEFAGQVGSSRHALDCGQIAKDACELADQLMHCPAHREHVQHVGERPGSAASNWEPISVLDWNYTDRVLFCRVDNQANDIAVWVARPSEIQMARPPEQYAQWWAHFKSPPWTSTRDGPIGPEVP